MGIFNSLMKVFLIISEEYCNYIYKLWLPKGGKLRAMWPISEKDKDWDLISDYR